ncbi:MAG: polyprenyl diphosphate synthase [Proteobacteria bacterium]|nr:polyprenyl diphosphate synthase [Pseudomonadota bacterium]
MPLVRVDRIPHHIAIIMDGNGRWAGRLGQPRTYGHRAGSEAVRRAVRACRKLGVSALSLYAFSEQNWHRPPEEVRALMDLFREFLISERQEILRTSIRVKTIGRVERLPPDVGQVLEALVAETRDLRGMTLQLAVSYGGREEIADTAKRLAQHAAAGRIDPACVDEAFFASELPSVGAGPVDLLIRTGGEQRISNFLLWGAAYAELYFSDTLWPDFAEEHLYAAIQAFQRRDRRFGRVASDDVHTGDPGDGARVHA